MECLAEPIILYCLAIYFSFFHIGGESVDQSVCLGQGSSAFPHPVLRFFMPWKTLENLANPIVLFNKLLRHIENFSWRSYYVGKQLWVFMKFHTILQLSFVGKASLDTPILYSVRGFKDLCNGSADTPFPALSSNAPKSARTRGGYFNANDISTSIFFFSRIPTIDDNLLIDFSMQIGQTGVNGFWKF